MRLIDADTIFNNKMLVVRTECYDAVRAVIERINNAPTVDAVPREWHDKCMEIEIKKRMDMEKHGHWIHRYDAWVCSECNYAFHGKPLWKYCPHCGAKNEVEDGKV